MAKRPRTPDDYDSPWKEALQFYFPSFLAFFFSDIHQDIDWSRGYESLDKEFQQILRRAKLGKLLADKLFKVWLRDGTDCWILIHVEIQSEAEKEFPRRMFEYHLAIRRLYNREVVGLALLCDDQPSWKPTQFSYERWGCRIELTFRIAKLLDCLPHRDVLEASDNPIAAVVLADLEAKATRDDPASRKDRKLRLAKGLLQRNWSADDVRELFRLIDWLMTLPEDLDEAFHAEYYQFQEEKAVPFVTSIERVGIKKGWRQAIIFELEEKFGLESRELLPKIEAIREIDALRKLMRIVHRAKTLEKVRNHLK